MQKFAQELLSVADNLESAARAVPQEVLQPGAEIAADKALGYLKSLLEGVQATEKVLLKVKHTTAGTMQRALGCSVLLQQQVASC